MKGSQRNAEGEGMEAGEPPCIRPRAHLSPDSGAVGPILLGLLEWVTTTCNPKTALSVVCPQ